MIDLPTHFALSITSSAIIGTAALVLAFLRIPHGGQWDKLSHARWVLFATFAILSFSGYFKASDEDVQLLSLATLSVASYQALLFSYTSSVLIAPGQFPARRFALILVLISLACLLLGCSKALFPLLYSALWPLALLAYTVQLVVHTYMFRRLAHRAQANLEDYYDDDVTAHLTPVRRMFYSALVVGVMALAVSVMPMDNLRYNIFVAGYTVYYLGVAITVVNYVTYGTFFVQAAGYEAPVECMDEPSETEADAFVPDLKAALGRWVERKAYLETDTSTDLIAGQLGVTRQQLSSYMRTEYGTTFRSWRMRLRLQYAQELIAQNPHMKLSQVYERAGFNDRSNFYKEFCKFAGMTPQAYRDKFIVCG